MKFLVCCVCVCVLCVCVCVCVVLCGCVCGVCVCACLFFSFLLGSGSAIMASRSLYACFFGLRIYSCFAHSVCRRMLVLVLAPPSLYVVVVILCASISRIFGCEGPIPNFMRCRRSMSGIVGEAVVDVFRCDVLLSKLGSGSGRFRVSA
jgi:hypothetical protein